MDIDALLLKVEEKYAQQPHSTIDGLKIEFDKQWVHLRKSNTEPIIRIYSEAENETAANALAQQLINDMKAILGI
jgi:phosphomannomutase